MSRKPKQQTDDGYAADWDTPAPAPVPDLAPEVVKLTKQANDAHNAVRIHQNGALKEARKAGDVLLKIKSRLKGDWSKWLQERFAGSERTAQIYMQIANGWATIGPAVDRDEVESLNAALRLLGSGRPRAADRPTATRKQIVAAIREVVNAADDEAFDAIGRDWPQLAEALRLLRDLVG